MYKYFTIYKITNKKNNKFYIGMHRTNNINDGYMGSGKLIRRAFNKYGLDNFIKEILYVFDNEEAMILKEKELVKIGSLSYNMNEGGKGGFGFINALGLNRGSNNVMNSNIEAKTRCIENGKKTRKENKVFYDEISRKNISISHKNRLGIKDPIHGEKMKIIIKEVWSRPGVREKIRDAKSFWFEIITPEGYVTKTNRLKEFCNINQIPYISLYSASKRNLSISKGKAKGWKCRQIIAP